MVSLLSLKVVLHISVLSLEVAISTLSMEEWLFTLSLQVILLIFLLGCMLPTLSLRVKFRILCVELRVMFVIKLVSGSN